MQDFNTENLLKSREYQGAQQIIGPLLFLDQIHNVGYNELVEIKGGGEADRLGMVLDLA